MMNRFWNDESGATISAEVAMVGTILVIGVIVGLSALQDAVNTELADLGASIANIDQSYSTSTTTGHHSSVSGFSFLDSLDPCDQADPTGGSRCLVLCTADPFGSDTGAGGSTSPVVAPTTGGGGTNTGGGGTNTGGTTGGGTNTGGGGSTGGSGGSGGSSAV